MERGSIDTATAPPRPFSRAPSRPDGGRVAVVGGGIGGLASAHYLHRAGYEVELFEATDRFGGLGTFFRHGDVTLERFYHVMLPGDDDLFSLCEDLGIRDRIYWAEGSLGFIYRGKGYPLVDPLDLLRFRPLPLLARLRLGLASLYMAHVADPDRLDDVTAEEWLRRLSGRTAFERLWKPLLRAKFGDAYRRIPALWYWSTFTREKGTGKELKGYIEGGYRFLAETLVSELRDAGVGLHLESPVERMGLGDGDGVRVEVGGASRTFDRLVSTLPLPALRRVAVGNALGEALSAACPDVDYQGVVNVVALLKRSLTPHYWIPVVDSGAPFQGIVETTRVIDPEETGGRHLVYLTSYVHRSEALFQLEDAVIRERFLDGLFRLFPALTDDDVVATYVFRAPFVQPLYEPGYGKRKPPVELVPRRFYLATGAQVYPGINSWNSTVGLARRAARAVVRSGEEAAT